VTAFVEWLFAAGRARRLAWFRCGLGAIVVARIVSWPFASLAGTPRPVLRPPLFLTWLPGLPPAPVIVALQVIGAAAGVWALLGRRGSARAFSFAWAILLVLAGMKTSTGKILHNDVLLVLAAFPLAICGVDASRDASRDDRESSAFGWPVRAALVVVVIVYFMSGVQKLVHTGPSWVTGDNMRWILADAIDGGRAPTSAIASALVAAPWACHLLAAGLLGTELCFPIVLWSRRARPAFAALAFLLHTGTWLTLGLDYWAWSLVALVVLGAASTEPVRRVTAEVQPALP